MPTLEKKSIVDGVVVTVVVVVVVEREVKNKKLIKPGNYDVVLKDP